MFGQRVVKFLGRTWSSGLSGEAQGCKSRIGRRLWRGVMNTNGSGFAGVRVLASWGRGWCS